ncbi:MAG: hypothetical protein WDO17_11115 [Alphaproteobacteria bacterium]
MYGWNSFLAWSRSRVSKPDVPATTIAFFVCGCRRSASSSVGGKLSLHQDAAHIGRKRAVAELGPVDPAENHPTSGKNLASMIEQEVERGSINRDHCIDLLVGVFCTQKIPQQGLIAGAEARAIELLAIDFYPFRRIGRDGTDKLGIKSGESWQLGPFVEQQNDTTRRRRRQGTDDQDHPHGTREKQHAAQPRAPTLAYAETIEAGLSSGRSVRVYQSPPFRDLHRIRSFGGCFSLRLREKLDELIGVHRLRRDANVVHCN